jgi:hypothetical protein
VFLNTLVCIKQEQHVEYNIYGCMYIYYHIMSLIQSETGADSAPVTMIIFL